MGRSATLHDPHVEPGDATVVHMASQRKYTAIHQAGWLMHQEWSLSPSGTELLLLSEYPVRYVIGSGRHSRSYLIEQDGFLMESPLTWYSSLQKWDMSPGYHRAEQPGFQRETGRDCLRCHMGQTEFPDHSLHRATIIETSISCERCHGPGSLHVAKHQNATTQSASLSGRDTTIINPQRLSRTLADAICQQCHLRSDAQVPADGHEYGDFVPGHPLTEFRRDFRFSTDSSMTVVGHAEQLLLSACYRKSDSLTCVTCHHPHDTTSAEMSETKYRQVCLSCHQESDCSNPLLERQATKPADNCIECHMPRTGTDIPHHAFTHHRIMRRPNDETPAALPQSDLTPVLTDDATNAAELERDLSLAWFQIAMESDDPGIRQRAWDQAAMRLAELDEQGTTDPQILAALARMSFEFGASESLDFAREAFSQGELPAKEWANTRYILAVGYANRGDYKQAAESFLLLTQSRRSAGDWLAYADCARHLGDSKLEIHALEQAVAINPRLSKVHTFLAEHFERMGKHDRAKWHRDRIVESAK